MTNRRHTVLLKARGLSKRYPFPPPIVSSLLTWIVFSVFVLSDLTAQTVIFSDPGRTYNDTDGPTFDSYGPVNISNCSSVRFELDYNFSLPWEGSGNMESSDECNFATPPCAGNPQMPLGPCANCWDFLWAQFIIDGATVGGDLIGEAGTTNSEQSGSITLDRCTFGNNATASINVTTQTWASNEAVTFSRIMIICYEGLPTANATPDPICQDEVLFLNGSVGDPGAVTNTMWSGPGNIEDPLSLTTRVNNLPPGVATFTLSSTDANNCTSTDQVSIIVHPTPNAFPAGPLTACASMGNQATFDLTTLDLTISGGGADPVQWYRDPGLNNQIVPPNLFTTGSTTVYAVVNNGFCESEVIEVELIVKQNPTARGTMLEACEEVPGSGRATFDLTELDDEVNAGQGFMVNYYSDPAGLIPLPSPYNTGTATIYAKVINEECESSLVQIRLIVYPRPMGRSLTLEFCEDPSGSGKYDIDLRSLLDSVRLNSSHDVEFFEDALFLTEANNPYRALEGSNTIYARIFDGRCESDAISISIEVLPTPFIRGTTLSICEDPPGSGQGVFELDSIVDILIGSQNLMVEWYADSLLTTTFSKTYTGPDTTIFVRATNGLCASDTQRIELRTIMPPTAQPYGDTACADQSGRAFFDLTRLDSFIANDLTVEEVFYAFDSTFNQQAGTSLVSGDTIIWARVFNGACPSEVVPIELVAIPSPFFNRVNDEVACDSFELPDLSGLNLTGAQAYYSGINGMGQRLDPGDIIRSTTKLFLYDQNGICEAQDSFNITIIESPNAGLNDTINVCEGATVDLSTYLVQADPGGRFTDDSSSMALTDSLFDATGLDGRTLSFSYVVDGLSPCRADSAIIFVNVVEEVEAGLDSTVTVCLGDSVDLQGLLRNADAGGSFMEAMPSGGLQGQLFVTGLAGTGSFDFEYVIGDGVVCPERRSSFQVTVLEGAAIDPIRDTSICDFFILQDIQGTNTTNVSYYTQPNGSGLSLQAGDTIFNSTTVFAYGGIGQCNDEETFDVTILQPAEVLIQDEYCADSTVIIGGETFDFDRPSDTIVLEGAAGNGCDSIIMVNLSFLPLSTEYLTTRICREDSIIINGRVYDQGNPTGTEIFPNASWRGCDSIVNINLAFFPSPVGILNTTLCGEDSIIINGRVYDETNASGTEVLENASWRGCDSIVTVQLSFYDPQSTIDSTLCPGEALVVNGRVYDEQNRQGTENLEGASWRGCDSLVSVVISYYAPAESMIEQTLCVGSSIEINGVTYDESNPRGRDTLFGASSSGCDSIVSINLDFVNSADLFISEAICEGDSLDINGVIYDANNPSGRDTLFGAASNGCDSVIHIDLEFISPGVSEISATLCPDEFLEVAGTRFDEDRASGSVRLEGQSVSGCDSIINVNLTYEDFFVDPGYQEFDIVLGDSVQVNFLTDLPFDSIIWNTTEGVSCTDCLNPVFSPTTNTTYIITFVDENGCTLTAEVRFTVSVVRNVYLPNTFSPNGDNLNDRIRLFARDGVIDVIETFEVYDRWGELVYREENTRPDNGTHLGWDGLFNGEPVVPDVFVILTRYRLRSGDSEQLSQSVTVIR